MASTGGVELVLVRHGRTASNAARRFLGQTDEPLDEEGHAQARALAASWPHGPFDGVVSSPLQRALQTARYLHPEPRIVDALAELHQGELEGLEVAAAVARHEAFFRAWAADPTGVPVPGGESLDQCRDRAWEALQALSRELEPGRRVVVATHQLVIASVCATVDGAPLRDWRQYAVDNTGSRRLVRGAGRWHLSPE